MPSVDIPNDPDKKKVLTSSENEPREETASQDSLDKEKEALALARIMPVAVSQMGKPRPGEERDFALVTMRVARDALSFLKSKGIDVAELADYPSALKEQRLVGIARTDAIKSTDKYDPEIIGNLLEGALVYIKGFKLKPELKAKLIGAVWMMTAVSDRQDRAWDTGAYFRNADSEEDKEKATKALEADLGEMVAEIFLSHGTGGQTIPAEAIVEFLNNEGFSYVIGSVNVNEVIRIAVELSGAQIGGLNGEVVIFPPESK